MKRPVTRTRALAPLLAALLVAAACSSGTARTSAGEGGSTTTGTSVPTASATEVDPAVFADVDAKLREQVQAKGLNGAGLVIVDRERGRIHESYVGDFGPDRVSLIASSSKMLTAGVLLRLADQGVLDLDAPVAKVAPWGAAHPDITPAQLISNSSGLPGLEDGLGIPDYLCQYIPSGTLQACAEKVFTTPQDDAQMIPPDTQFRYGGAQWQVAGAVAEAASGKSWAELVRGTYVEPCGTGSLAYNNHFGVMSGAKGTFSYPAAFNADPATLRPTENPNMEGGAYVTPRDYAELLLMQLRGGRCGDTRVLSSDAVQRMQADRIGEVYEGTTGSEGLEGYGMGWWVDRGQQGLVEDAGAYGTVPWIDRGRRYAAYLVVEDTFETGSAMARELRPMIDRAVKASR
ncbi:MAG: serine hydrolase domain-containing protein [Microthrixaceae bacterium]